MRSLAGPGAPPIALLLLLLLPARSAVDAFVLNGGVDVSAVSLAQFPAGAFRWSVPASTSSAEGLGGGISWVLDDAFCSDMIGLFPERDILPLGLKLPSAFQFVHCNDLRDAVQRGFATWTANHHLVKFVDVSTAAPCTAAASRTGAMQDSCPWELYVGTDDGTSHPSLAAYVTNHRMSEVDPQWFSRPLRSASGSVAYGVDAHARSVMRFQTHLCWYLDATFCWYFQQLKEVHGMDVLLLTRVVVFTVFGLAAMRLCMVVFWCLVALMCLQGSQLESVQRRGGRSARCSACLNYLSSLSPCTNLLVLFFLIFPLIFYDRIFLPCHECYDFEAAVAHEAGHVLGFGHPDAVPEANIAASCGVSNATCRDPFGMCASSVAYDPGERSIMQALTQQAPRTCLSQGDLDGLRFLYPLCDDLAPTVVSCFKGRRLSGWLRLALVTSAPFLLSVFAILLPLTCLRWRDRRRIKRLGKELGDAEAQVRAYKNELKKALRGAVADAVERPATALRDAVRGKRAPPARVAPVGGEARAAPATKQGVAKQGAAKPGGAKPGAAKPGGAKRSAANPGTQTRQPAQAAKGLQKTPSCNGYVGPTWPGAPKPR